MQNIFIEKTKSTPQIEFDTQSHILSIEGQSYPENAFKFYEPVFQWLDTQLEQSQREVILELNFHMPYINTSSSKCIMMLLEKLENSYRKGKKITIRWYYNEDNEVALECAEEFKEDLTLPFDLCMVEET